MSDSNSADPRHRGVLLVGHGTRDPNGTREFFQLASVLSERLAPIAVEASLLEFQHPTIPEAWERLVTRGVKQVRVAPLLLFAAGHARGDIPEMVFACAAMTPEIGYSQSDPLSRAPSIVELLAERIVQAAQRTRLSIDASVALVMVGRGSYDPCAKADMLLLGEIVAHRLGFETHGVGFYAMADPRLPETLDRIARRPGIRSVIVQPHLLFQGRLYDAIVQQVEQASGRHPDVRFVVGDYLGPTIQVADAVARRVLSDPAFSWKSTSAEMPEDAG